MIKGVWLTFFCILFIGCASAPNTEVQPNSEEGTIISPLPKPEVSKNSFPAYFSAISDDILLDIQMGTPESIQRAVAQLRSNYDDSVEQASVLLALCSTILDYAWPSFSYTKFTYSNVPTNVYTSTLESIHRGIYESSFGSGDFFTLTIPSLVLFSSEQTKVYYAEALASLEDSLKMDENSVLTLYLLGVLSMYMENYPTAIEYLQNAMSLDNENLDIVYAYYNALLLSENKQEAYSFGQDLLIRYPSNSKILELSALAAFNIENYEDAESLIAQSIQLDPSNTTYLLFRAKVLFELGDYLDVSSLLDVYSKTGSQNRDYLLLRARLQSTWNKNVPSALKTIQEALTLYPDDVEVLLFAANLASMNAQNVMGKTALELIQLVLEKDPQNRQALNVLVKESIAQQYWQEAYDASSIVLAQGNYSLIEALQHVEICITLNYLTEARNTINNFYFSGAADESLQQWYIRLLIAEGNSSEAGKIIAGLLPSASARMKSALYFERSRLQTMDERILSDLRSSLTSNPRNEFALFGLYEYYYERFDYSKAQYYLKQVIALNPSNTDALERNSELDALLR